MEDVSSRVGLRSFFSLLTSSSSTSEWEPGAELKLWLPAAEPLSVPISDSERANSELSSSLAGRTRFWRSMVSRS